MAEDVMKAAECEKCKEDDCYVSEGKRGEIARRYARQIAQELPKRAGLA